MFLSIAGDTNEDCHQVFKHVILDEKFYNENVFKWLLNTFYSSNNSNPVFENKTEEKLFNKKFGGFSIKKASDCLVAPCPKVYCFYNLKDILVVNEKQYGQRPRMPLASYKVKGVCKKQNPLTPQDYIDVLDQKKILQGKNTNLQLYKGIMSKIIMTKNVLTPIHTKFQVVNDFASTISLKMKYQESNLSSVEEILFTRLLEESFQE
jgi:hypothetical protein